MLAVHDGTAVVAERHNKAFGGQTIKMETGTERPDPDRMMLSEFCNNFAVGVEALDPKAEGYASDLRPLVLRLIRDSANHVEDHAMGEVPALLELARIVLAWLKSEAEDTEDRQRRSARQQAVLNLLVLCEGIARFHAGKRKPADVAAMRDQVADALQGLVS